MTNSAIFTRIESLNLHSTMKQHIHLASLLPVTVLENENPDEVRLETNDPCFMNGENYVCVRKDGLYINAMATTGLYKRVFDNANPNRSGITLYIPPRFLAFSANMKGSKAVLTLTEPPKNSFISLSLSKGSSLFVKNMTLTADSANVSFFTSKGEVCLTAVGHSVISGYGAFRPLEMNILSPHARIETTGTVTKRSIGPNCSPA